MFNLLHYQCKAELRLDHPEYTSFRLVLETPPNQSLELNAVEVTKALRRQRLDSPVVFQIPDPPFGDQFWIPVRPRS